MRLSVVTSHQHLLRSVIRFGSCQTVPFWSASAGLRLRASTVTRASSQFVNSRSSLIQATSAVSAPASTPSMASDLPQAMLADLQLLHQHYEQLPFVLDPSLALPMPAAATSGIIQGSDGTLVPGDGPKAAATAAQQLLTSSSAAAAEGVKHKRSHLSRKDAALLRLQKYVDSLNSNRSNPNSLAEATTDPNPNDTVVSTAAEELGLPAVAADGATQHQVDLPAAAPTALELTTPPAKPPRSRRGRKAATAAAPQPTAADAQLHTAPAGAAASLPAAVPLVADEATAGPPADSGVASLPSKKRGRRQSGKQLAADLAPQQPAAAAAAAMPEADEADTPAAAPAVPKSRSRKRKVTVAVTVTEEPITDQPSTTTSASPAVVAAGMLADTIAEATAVAAAGATTGGRGRGKSSSAGSRGTARGRKAAAAAAQPEDDAGQLGLDDAAAGSDPDPAAAAAAPKPLVKSRRGRRTTAAAAGAAAAGPTDTPPDPAAAAAAAAEAKPAKPVRRTKKVIAAEVLEAASQGQFGELTNLSSTYSHVALFTNTSNTAAWQALVQQEQLQVSSADTAAAVSAADAAADVPGSQQQQQLQQQVGRSSSLSLCRSSGLGSFRQQVWIHSQSQGLGDADALGTQGTVFDAEAVGTPAQVTLLPSESQPAAAAAGSEGDQQPTAAAAAKQNGAANGSKAVEGAAAAAGTQEQVTLPPALPLTPELQQQQLKVLPNLGYACLCMTMRKYEIFNSRDCVKKTRDAADGLQKVSELALQNARDLVPLIHWNEAHGIRLFRLSSNIFPWMVSYKFEDLPHWPDIQKALRAAGDLAKQLGHRLTFHPSEFCKIAGERPEWVTQSVAELEVHSRIFDEMGFLPATPYNKINIHVGGTYGDKDAALQRFSEVVNTRLSPNCKARLTVENDDRASLYSVVDLMRVHQATGIPIVFDFHHWKFCTGDQTQEEAFRTALTTWPSGVRPVVHWSESPEDPKKMLKAHSEYIDGPINLYGLEGDVDVMIESKGKELALLEYRQYVVEGCSWPMGPRSARTVKFAADAAAAAAAAAAAEEDSDSEESQEWASSADDE